LKHGVLQVNKAIYAINLNIYQEHVDTDSQLKDSAEVDGGQCALLLACRFDCLAVVFDCKPCMRLYQAKNRCMGATAVFGEVRYLSV